MNKSILPNLFTFSNLAFGMLSILFTLTNNLTTAAFMIICAAFIDRYDGRIARFVGAESPLGKELDSLADLISFGAAPAILSWGVFLNSYGIIGYIITILFPVAGAYRLARYNVTQFDKVFRGIPITIAGFTAALINLIVIYSPQNSTLKLFIQFFILLLSYLMVSKIKIKKI